MSTEAIELVRAFVNSFDVDVDAETADALSTPAGLRDWLSEHGLLDEPARVSGAEHRRAVELRDALRAAVHARSHGDPVDTARTEAALAPYAVRVRLDSGGALALTAPAAASPVDTGVARIVAALVQAQHDGTWVRLKLCAEQTCAWAFVDRSKNRSGRWCSMQVCGNRTKTRAYRSRQRS